MRYFNHPGGSKPSGTTEGRTKYAAGSAEDGPSAFVPTGEVSKKESADEFKRVWRMVVEEDEVYMRMKKEWMKNEGRVATVVPEEEGSKADTGP